MKVYRRNFSFYRRLAAIGESIQTPQRIAAEFVMAMEPSVKPPAAFTTKTRDQDTRKSSLFLPDQETSKLRKWETVKIILESEFLTLMSISSTESGKCLKLATNKAKVMYIMYNIIICSFTHNSELWTLFGQADHLGWRISGGWHSGTIWTRSWKREDQNSGTDKGRYLHLCEFILLYTSGQN